MRIEMLLELQGLWQNQVGGFVCNYYGHMYAKSHQGLCIIGRVTP